MSQEILSDPEGQFPSTYNRSTFMFGMACLAIPSATAKPDRPCWQIGEVRRLLLVQWFGRRDRPLGEGRRSAPVPERDP